MNEIESQNKEAKKKRENAIQIKIRLQNKLEGKNSLSEEQKKKSK